MKETKKVGIPNPQQFYCAICKSSYPCSFENFGVKCKYEIDYELTVYGKSND